MSTAAYKRYELEVEQLLGKGRRKPVLEIEDAGEAAEDSIEDDHDRLRLSDRDESDIASWVGRIEKSEGAKKQKISEIDNENGEYPFAPRISMKSRQMWENSPQDPIYERYQKVLNNRDQKIKNKKEELAKQKKINEENIDGVPLKNGRPDMSHMTKSQKIEHKIRSEKSKSKNKSPSIYDREKAYDTGMNWLRQRDDKLAETQTERLESEVAGISFTPTINRNNKYYSSISKSFEKRQKLFDEEKKQRQLKVEQDEYSRRKFKPHINEKSRRIAKKKLIEEQIATKATLLEKQLHADTFEEEEIFRSAPNKQPNLHWHDTTVSDFGASLDSGLPLKRPDTKNRGIHDLKSYPARVTNKIIPKIPQDEDLKNGFDDYYYSIHPSKDFSRSAKKSIGKLSPSPLAVRTQEAPKIVSKSPKVSPRRTKNIVSDRDEMIRKSSPNTPGRKKVNAV
jgi:hypothetical protein